jgi:hypothetical protein
VSSAIRCGLPRGYTTSGFATELFFVPRYPPPDSFNAHTASGPEHATFSATIVGKNMAPMTVTAVGRGSTSASSGPKATTPHTWTIRAEQQCSKVGSLVRYVTVVIGRM